MNPARSYLKTQYTALRQALTPATAQFPNVELLSYHIPKTAGTSLYFILEDVYGAGQIKRVYDAEAAKRLTRGNPLWVPNKTLVLHGHFEPNPNHTKQYPNAKRIIWVRDPIERTWSFLRHWLKTEDDPLYETFKAKHIVGNAYDAPELFDKLVRDDDFKYIRRFYQIFLRKVAPNHFDFIAKMEDFDTELPRLSSVLGQPLCERTENKNPVDAELPFPKSKYAHIFRSEYDFLAKTYNIHYPI
jgi:hypothetical protein